MLREALSVQGIECGCDRGLLGEIRCLILKADVERRLVYSVIAEPDTVDAQGDVMSAETIEEMAHNFLLRSRKFDNRHDWKAVDAAPVESWISERGYGAPEGEDQGQFLGGRGKGLCRPFWKKVLSKEYQSFIIGGRGVRVPRVRFIPRSRAI
jgi:hypothetical protein